MINAMIVEDSLVIMEHLRHILESDPNVRVIAVGKNGREAVEIADSTRPDVIIMDINMPEMTGFEATRRIMATNPIRPGDDIITS